MAATNTIINPQYKPIEPEKNDGLPIPKPVQQAQIGVTAPTAGAAVKQDEWWKTPADTTTIGTVTSATPGLMSASPATVDQSSSYTNTDWKVNPNQTVQGQADAIIAKDSPLQQRAAMRADQQMNKRGLMNSSMAVGAGQAAIMDYALPIAQADAQVNAQSANFNANAANAASQFNASNQQQSNIFNATQKNQTAQFNAGQTQQTNLANAAALNAAQSESNKIRQQAATLNQDAGNKLLMQDLDNQFKAAISNADMASKAALQSMADQTKKDLASVEATYKQMLSTNEQAGSMYAKVMQNITDIVNNPDISSTVDPATGKSPKDVAIDNQKQMLVSGMEIVSKVSGLNLQDILDFTTP